LNNLTVFSKLSSLITITKNLCIIAEINYKIKNELILIICLK